ncbi:DUF4129 domain-containing protein [Kibdelosporangium phytohabitans]|uniref:Protein-glutamine gamma-glutamyltransferase-like C-terminal domain-containing protein n=1 Tax=Kibdelosporangium phytohabitans TaxID=860235 RepID=A0A0N9HWN2_9PSEU|nr:DUF4129 domain-containing protein [Kibdelosporangium phytohabitans]ALG06545.1 hypothetical protein AOZ06_06040 [Kibdelosporangium phytohabitans]MBE1467730.1 hypothetical protein [Kibdelosporangium phytohabitans]
MKVRLPVLLAVAAFLLLAVVAARGSSGIPTGVVEPGAGSGSAASGGAPPEAPPVSSDVFGYGAGVVIVLVFVVAFFGLAILLVALSGIRARRHKRARQRGIVADEVVDGAEPWLARAGKRALLELDSKVGGPPSDAVIAAWVQLERSAAETGVERQPHQTPTEFTAAVLAAQNADAEALATLRKLYHRARFGRPGGVTDDDAVLARRALEQIA